MTDVCTTKGEVMAEAKKEQTKEETAAQVAEVKETPKAATTAKAGKRSTKALKEAEEKQAKEARKENATEETDKAKPKQPVKPARSILERKGKKFREAAKLIDKTKEYSLAEALELAGKTNPAKFDASVELHIKLGVDPRQADQNIRGTVTLPAGSGRTVRVAVFADVDDAKKAQAAGADITGSDDFLQKLDKEQLDFDVLISTPQMMAKLGKYARLLGPKGLMPNPKSGTVTKDVATAVKEAKAGKVEYRVDSTGIIHLSIGKASFKPEDLEQNANAIINAIKTAKPASLKGSYIQSVFVTTTMGPSIHVNNSDV